MDTTTNLPVISPGGRFSSAFPLWDGTGRILVTWSECRLQDTTGTILPCTSANLADATLTAAPVLYSAWMFDPAANTFMPLITPTEGVFVDRHRRAAAAPTHPGLHRRQLRYDHDAPLGIIDIRSVYDWDGAACNGADTAMYAATSRPPAASPAWRRPRPICDRRASCAS